MFDRPTVADPKSRDLERFCPVKFTSYGAKNLPFDPPAQQLRSRNLPLNTPRSLLRAPKILPQPPHLAIFAFNRAVQWLPFQQHAGQLPELSLLGPLSLVVSSILLIYTPRTLLSRTD